MPSSGYTHIQTHTYKKSIQHRDWWRNMTLMPFGFSVEIWESKIGFWRYDILFAFFVVEAEKQSPNERHKVVQFMFGAKNSKTQVKVYYFNLFWPLYGLYISSKTLYSTLSFFGQALDSVLCLSANILRTFGLLFK